MRSASEQHLYSRHQTTGRVGYLRSKYVETGRPEGLGVQPPILEVCLAAFAIAFDRLNHTRASRRQLRKNTRFSDSHSTFPIKWLSLRMKMTVTTLRHTQPYDEETND